MIQAHLKPYTLKRSTKQLDAYAQPSTAVTAVGVVQVSIYLQTQVANTNDVRYKDATHIGLTKDKTIQEGDILEGTASYRVLLVNNDGRLTQLTLKGV